MQTTYYMKCSKQGGNMNFKRKKSYNFYWSQFKKFKNKSIKIEKIKIWILKKVGFQNNLQNGFDGFEILDGVVGWAMKP